jgi:hypothetical protein
MRSNIISGSTIAVAAIAIAPTGGVSTQAAAKQLHKHGKAPKQAETSRTAKSGAKGAERRRCAAKGGCAIPPR